jgi:hypothetical protein
MEILDELKQLQSNKTSLASSPAKFEKIQERSHIGSKFKNSARESSPQEGVKETYNYKVIRSRRAEPGAEIEYIKDTYIDKIPVNKKVDSPSPVGIEPKIPILREEDTPTSLQKQESEEIEKPTIIIREASDELSPLKDSERREMRKRIVQGRSPAKNVTTKTWKKGGKKYKTKTTSYTMHHSPGGRRTVVEKIYQSSGGDSPTKKMIDHKNASLKHKMNAAKVQGGRNKMLYTLDPKNAYLVDRDYPQEMSRGEIIDKTMNDRKGFSERYIEDDGTVVTKYYYSSPQAHKVKKGGKLVEATKEFEVSPSKRVHAQEFFQNSSLDEIMSPSHFETRKDLIRRMEDRTKQLHEEFERDSGFRFGSEFGNDRADRYHDLLRDNLSRSFK